MEGSVTGVFQSPPEQIASLPGFSQNKTKQNAKHSIPPCLPGAVRTVGSPSPCPGLLLCAFLPASGEDASPPSFIITKVLLPEQSLTDADYHFS